MNNKMMNNKMMNNKMISRLLIAILIMLSTSCAHKPTWEYQIDNPLDTEIVLQIDGTEYSIPPQSTRSFNATQGKHTLTYNGSSVNFVTKVNSNKSTTIINPTLSNYMLRATFFTKGADISSYIYESNSCDYQSNVGVIKLPVRVLNTLFIEKSHTPWLYGLNQDSKSELETRAQGKELVFHKLYREAAYKTEFSDEFTNGVVFPINSKKLSEQAIYTFPTESLMCDCEAANTFVKDLANRCKTTMANPSDIFQEIAGMAFDAATGQSALNKECSTQHHPNRDDKEYKQTLKKLTAVMQYLTDASTFIVE